MRISKYFLTIFMVFFPSTNQLVSSQGTDQTILPEASGSVVVKATLARLKGSPLSDTSEFMRRLAYVESRDGTNNDTYREDYHGGIWQVDEETFNLTKDSSQYPVLVTLHTEIQTRFGILWPAIDWDDLRKPLYSAFAARLLIATFPSPVPSVADLDGQAVFWKQYYDTPIGSGTDEFFVSAVEALIESEVCTVSKLDLSFVVDGSGSVGHSNFIMSLDFVSEIVGSFDIGPDRVRVGFIQYSSRPSVEFWMNEHQDEETVRTAIGNISYNGAGTETGRAINFTINELFGKGNGSRPSEENVPRIGIVMTDGKSGDDVLGAADAARAAGITLFAIGIGDGIVEQELTDIGNDPDNVFLVNDFDVVNNIRSLISQSACEEPVEFEVGEAVSQILPPSATISIEIILPPSGMMTFTLSATVGQVTAYLSVQIRNPNEAFHDWFVEAFENDPLAQVFIDTNQGNDIRSRRKRQALNSTLNGQQELYGTIINTYNASGSAVNGTSTAAPDTVFVVIIDEGDTRNITTTVATSIAYAGERDISSTIMATSIYFATESGKPDSTLSVAIIAGISVAGFVVITVVVILVICLMKPTHVVKPEVGPAAGRDAHVNNAIAVTDLEPMPPAPVY